LATFRGEARGEILQMPLGRHGFGYDPLFYLPELNKTFAEMNAEEKAEHSHRGAAFKKLLAWLKGSG
jgi:non-canonical purine NTP pyrophosphatase (RdgB/HAM1 family)